MSVGRVRKAYGARAAEYTELFGTIDAASAIDRAYVLAWAQGLDGPVIDVGCGPGQWTDFLHRHGVDIEGIDPVPAFIDRARARFPGAVYRVGQANRIGAEHATLGGILAWFSLIHTAPNDIDGLLETFAVHLRPGGGLLMGFFEGPELVAFDHAVTTAYCWPAAELSARVVRVGLEVVDVTTRTDPGARPQGTLVARRTA